MHSSLEFLYNVNGQLIISVLFLLIFLTNEIGYRMGSYFQQRSTSKVRSHAKVILSGVMGLLALLLGFSFSIALQRYDDRSKSVILEANTIGTALLRTKLLPAPYNATTSSLLHQYIDLRIYAGQVGFTKSAERHELEKRTDNLQNLIWMQGVQAVNKDPKTVTTGKFMDALNEMIVARGARNANLLLHVPEAILFLLFVVCIIFGGLMGYSSGLEQNRDIIPGLFMAFLFTLVIYIIIDLDRPRRGLIRINDDSIRELQIKK